jgi:hypothetical protein
MTPDQPAKARVVLENSFVIESARLCVLELTLTHFGSRESLVLQCDTEGVEVIATEILSKKSSHHAMAMQNSAVVALRWRAKPPMVRLVCRSEKMNAAIGVSNFETTSLAQYVASADAHCLLALASILRPDIPELLPAHAHVLERMRKLGAREFFLNWLPAAEHRFACLVLQARLPDPAGLRLIPLNTASMELLLPVRYSTADNYLVLIYDLKDMSDPHTALELAAVIQERMHYWRLEPQANAGKSQATEAERLVGLASRWTERVCESVAVARSDLLMGARWQTPESGAMAVKFESEIDGPVLVITDVVDMFSLTLVMAAAETWKARFKRVFLLLPSWRGSPRPPEIDPLALMEEFGGSGVVEPVTTDELDSILQSLEAGSSISFASAAAPYNTPIDESGRTEFPIATFDLSSREKLRDLRRIVRYSMLAGGPLVWRELQCAFSNHPREGISIALLSEGKNASLAEDVYAAPCARLGWPVGALKHFDRQMFAAFRVGGFE